MQGPLSAVGFARQSFPLAGVVAPPAAHHCSTLKPAPLTKPKPPAVPRVCLWASGHAALPPRHSCVRLRRPCLGATPAFGHAAPRLLAALHPVTPQPPTTPPHASALRRPSPRLVAAAPRHRAGSSGHRRAGSSDPKIEGREEEDKVREEKK
ncbi:hypothetical protein PVAP13_8NG229401 [Panicum virgatum]|uniref:Uncharacterized protein n=1 Tax=Panicum virgatum TaxID=38727 RepID=A0A8T0PEN0_PANVG|nr:hypothetical protein PVAP13_8NG229401 [Panicum virgatum]